MTIYLFAAARTAGNTAEGYAIMALAGAVWLVCYAVACWVWPFANCRRCKGTARIMSPSGKAFRACRRCKSSGRRLRVGRWVFNYFHAKRGSS